MKRTIFNPFSMNADRGSHLHELFDRLAGAITSLETWRLRYHSNMQFARIEARILHHIDTSPAQRYIAINQPFGER